MSMGGEVHTRVLDSSDDCSGFAISWVISGGMTDSVSYWTHTLKLRESPKATQYRGTLATGLCDSR